MASLGLGAVLGPEGPLILLGSGVAVWLMRLFKADVPAQGQAMVGAAGSFAAVSTLLGPPITGAFLLMEVSGIGGPMLGVVLVPGLLAAGTGSLVFVGLDNWTGLGTFSLAIPDVPQATSPTVTELGWALVIGLLAASVGTGSRKLSLLLQARAERHLIPATVLMGLVVAGLAIAYAQGSGKAATEVLYSGQSALGPLLSNSAGYTVATLLLLLACKGLAYCASLSAFRGGPIFPAMFLGAAGGIALSHLPELQLTSAFAMGIGAMSVAMLKLPLTAVLLATLLLGVQGLTVMPLVILAVVVAHVVTLRPAGPTPVHRRRPRRHDEPSGGRPIPSMGPSRGNRQQSPHSCSVTAADAR
ncbi:chloride channel protein [Streptomyces sp. NPDC006544]|uniref:chloride channel protein n=1 Tax=Streptomyces sp. NPDC006544 TaxID=3154583 RepID=UPI0033B3C650